jgi:hypothetical protein
MGLATDECGYINKNVHRHKKCALIAVDEILNNGGTLYVIEHPSKTFSNGTNYWQEVKQEIINL